MSLIGESGDVNNPVLNQDNELNVYVTYKIQINNQTNKTAHVHEIVDYFSTDFTFDGIEIKEDSNINANPYSINEVPTSIEGKDYYSLNIKLEDINNSEDGSFKDGKAVIYIRFKVNKEDEAGKIKKGDNIGGNIAEIVSYGSDEGYIDMNSAPGNAINNSSVRYEDDTDKAGTLNINIDTDNKRTLSGVVWDDSSLDSDNEGYQDGEYLEGETLINGVTVQLIELKEIKIGEKTYQLEYIWQETETGSDNVKIINTEGQRVEIATNSINPEIDIGKYEFVGFIPGNYIVRYKYGTDGEHYDGNAYKSTYDSSREKYNSNTLNINVFNDDGSSVHDGSDAFDNEARRLGEMSIYAGQTITRDTIKNLSEHWMCADTSKFEVYFENPINQIDSQGEQLKQISVSDIERTYNSEKVYVDDNGVLKYKNNETAVHRDNNDDIVIKYEEYSITPIESNNNCNIQNIDFGLMKRPETEISLEKHLTALSIDVAGEGKILDATFDLAGYLNEKSTNAQLKTYLKGNADKLTQIYSTRDERGYWKVETDVNELMNGAELSAEYTYMVSNNTDNPDYLTKQLVDAYEKLSSGAECTFEFEDNPGVSITLKPSEGYTYQLLLEELENRTKTMIRTGTHSNGYYLGEYYYTGKTGDKDELVTVRIDKIEELINNDFNFDEKINYSSYWKNKNYFSTDEKAHEKYYYYDINGNGPKEIDISKYKVVQSKAGENFLKPKEKDFNRKILLTKTLNTNNINDMEFDSYNAEILSYSVASGRRSTTSIPGNLNDARYSYTADKTRTLETDKFETDEFWGETIIITAPTGEDGISTTLWIILGTTCALIIAGGIFGIKKFVLKH